MAVLRRREPAADDGPVPAVPEVFVLADWIDENEPMPSGPFDGHEREWRTIRARRRWQAAQRGETIPRSRSDAALVAEFRRERAAGKWTRTTRSTDRGNDDV